MEDLRRVVNQLAPHVAFFKIGLEIITAGLAFEARDFIHDAGAKVFLDIKLKDIPATVGKAAKNIAAEGFDLFNMHVSAGMEAMASAVANCGEAKIFGVTVLTSLDEEECNHIHGGPTKAKVLEFARDAAMANLDGIICSPQELAMLKKHSELANLKTIVPGIRPAGAAADDQKRIMTPAEAVKAGADYIVLGRPLLHPPEGTPEDAIERVNAEVDAAEEAS
jgi:orotidine-5'-phosphate decarboxylase